MPSPFDYVNDILQTKKNIIVDSDTEKAYAPYIVNRALAQHLDCILFANEMNVRPWVDKKLQYIFLINTIRSKKRRFEKWIKPEAIDDIESIKLYYNYNDAKAQEAYQLLSDDQIEQIIKMTDIGGLGV